MANICGVDFNIDFNSGESALEFVDDFHKEMEMAKVKNEGVPIAENDGLFDPVIRTSGDVGVLLSGWVKWGLSHESMIEFSKRLEKSGMTSFDCSYEECGNNIFGRYEYYDGVLTKTSLDESHPVWEKVENGEEDSWEQLEEALEFEGVTRMVA